MSDFEGYRVIEYKRLTVRHDDNHFSVYCMEQSLTHRRDDVMRWIKRLAGRLHWTQYDIAVTTTTKEIATTRPSALFETHNT